MRFFIVLLLLAIPMTSFGAEIISVQQAHERLKDEEFLLIDVRRPSEWEETGVADGALRISMHQDGFLEKLDALIAGDKTREFALICATGGRTGWLAKQLEGRGYTSILDVSEGMYGSTRGAGWLKSGLPLAE